MPDLLGRMLEGVDLTAPDAAWQIFTNLMALMPWGLITAWTVLCVLVGLAIAWHRHSPFGMAVLWALLLGPVGWVISWQTGRPARHCERCRQWLPARHRRCPHCGCRQRASAATKPAAGRESGGNGQGL